MTERSKKFIQEISTALQALEGMDAELQAAADIVQNSLFSQAKIYSAGNGGAASISQHFVSELVGKFELNRPPWAAQDLSENSATLTAIANDFGFNEVFSRQLAAVMTSDDTFIALSTSGKSKNILCAIEEALSVHAAVVFITGTDSPIINRTRLLHIVLPSSMTAIVQHLQMAFLHALCLELDARFFSIGHVTQFDQTDTLD